MYDKNFIITNLRFCNSEILNLPQAKVWTKVFCRYTKLHYLQDHVEYLEKY